MYVINKHNIPSILTIFFESSYQCLGQALGPPFGPMLAQKPSWPYQSAWTEVPSTHVQVIHHHLIFCFSLCPLEVNIHNYLTIWLSSCPVGIFFGFITIIVNLKTHKQRLTYKMCNPKFNVHHIYSLGRKYNLSYLVLLTLIRLRTYQNLYTITINW